ncbi:hypothetical protein HUG17_2908 [Dermatophagoides farinae]|uniref:Uncharacterized protein n=1 Tax=Dermatophagoides farinae TaxID=6954 RepID=A0A9D4SFA1_DERFA|nr:hypothetical protein HUG17_2908 [Dermatophagoides farinae]
MAILAIISAIFLTIINPQIVDCGGYHGGYGYVQPIYYPVHGKEKQNIHNINTSTITTTITTTAHINITANHNHNGDDIYHYGSIYSSTNHQ